MDLIPSKKILILKIFLSIIFFLTISLFFSAQKISLLLVFTIIFFLLKTNYQKVIVINLILLTVFIKIIILPFQLKTQEINPSKVEIYEKHFLYGVKNINFNKSYINGDLSSLDKKYKEKYRNLNNKKIKIITDNLGFRNKIKPNDADYILVGDSFLHQLNISQKNILNNILNKNPNLKTYNAGLASTDISHYFETIKFFKDKMNLKNKKYVMYIFQGNDFLSYKSKDNNNYHKYINNYFLNSYFKFKTFFNFYNTFKYFSYYIKNENDFVKVYEYDIKNQKALFKFDYIYKKNSPISQINSIFKKYKNYLPDLIIFIPTKYEVYCDLINNSSCEDSEHFSILSSDPLLKDIDVFNSTKFFKDNSKFFIKTENKLLYEKDDSHLNELGIKLLSDYTEKLLLLL